MGEHKVYTGHHSHGLNGYLAVFGKCLCGAVLMSQQEIDEHKELEDA